MPTSRAGEPAAAGLRAARGLTLIELLVVLTVLGLLATLATPAIRGALPGQVLRVAAQDLRTTLRETRMRAMRENREAVTVIDVEAATVQGDWQDRARRLPEGVRVELSTARRERLSATSGRVRFFPDGTSTGARVTLGGAGRAWALEVDWFDGRVTLRGPDA